MGRGDTNTAKKCSGDEHAQLKLGPKAKGEKLFKHASIVEFSGSIVKWGISQFSLLSSCSCTRCEMILLWLVR